MVTLEQVKLLESKVGKALEYIETLSAENTTLRGKLDGYRRRIDELETIVLAFKEDQGKIEAGIVSALERLNQFEDAVERGIEDARNDAPEIDPPKVDESPAKDEIADDAEENKELEAPIMDAEAVEIVDDEEETDVLALDDKNGELDIF